jgi:hypothetical protein
LNWITKSVKEVSRRQYEKAGVKAWRTFATEMELSEVPTAKAIISFIAYKSTSVAGDAMDTYLSAIVYWCKCREWDTKWNLDGRVRAAVQGLKQAGKISTRDERLPITEELTCDLKKYVKTDDKDQKRTLLAGWIATRAALRMGEYLPRTMTQDSPTRVKHLRKAKEGWVHLGVTRKSKKRASITWIRIPFNVTEGKKNTLTFDSLLKDFLDENKTRHPEDPLFVLEDGRLLSVGAVVGFYKRLVCQGRKQGIVTGTGKVSGHSFRRGAAHTLSKAGAPTTLIKAIGGWKSEAYRKYTNQDTTTEELARKTITSIGDEYTRKMRKTKKQRSKT